MKESDTNIWTFVHANDHKNIESHDPYFYIEQPYGEVHPRLSFENEVPSNQTRLNAITR